MSGRADKEVMVTTGLTVPDAILTAALAAFCVQAIVRRTAGADGPAVAYIYQRNSLKEVVSLKQEGTREFRAGKAQMKLEVRAGGIRVVESNCPERFCVRTGRISRQGQTIVCVPNRVVIEVRGGRRGYDAETY